MAPMRVPARFQVKPDSPAYTPRRGHVFRVLGIVLLLLEMSAAKAHSLNIKRDIQSTLKSNTRIETHSGVFVTLVEGQTAQVPGTDLTLTVGPVRDLTSNGCLGGPIGCLDTVQLKIIRGNLSRQITLSTAHTENQRDQGLNRINVFGREITLVTLANKQVVLEIGN